MLGLGLVVIQLVNIAFTLYFYLIIAHVIFSWIPVRQLWLMDIRDFVHRLTEPYLTAFRRFLPIVDLGGAGLDLSPLVGLLVLGFIQRLVVGLLQTLLLP